MHEKDGTIDRAGRAVVEGRRLVGPGRLNLVLAVSVASVLVGSASFGLASSEPASATTSTLWVSNGESVGTDTSCSQPGYLTISSALSAAVSGDTVMVCNDGSPYVEQVQVTTPEITVEGTNGTSTGAPEIEPDMAAPTTFTTSVTTDAFNLGGQTAAPIVYVNTTGVDLSDLALNADNSQVAGPPGDDLLLGLFYDSGSSGTVDNVSYTGNPSPAEHADSQSSAVFVNSGSTVTVENSDLQGFYKTGIVCNGDCTITGNTVQGVGPTGPGTTGPFSSAQNGVGMWEGASGTVSGNTIEDLDYPAGPQFNDTSGISVFDSPNVAVTDNTLTDVQEAVVVASTGSLAPDSVMTGDSVVGNAVGFDSAYTSGTTGTANNADGTEGIEVASYAGSDPSSVSVDVEDNSLSGPNFGNTTATPDVTDTGLQVGDVDANGPGGDVSVTAAGNTFTGWTADAAVVGTTSGTVTADLEHNDFDSASAYGVDNVSGTAASEGSGGTAETTPVTADATGSYWGCPGGPSGAPTNNCTTASANVGYSPALSSAEASASGTGPSATSAGVTVSGTGDGTVNVGQYGANPETTAVTGSANDYFDVDLAPSSDFTAATVTDCSLNSGNVLYWWNASGWAQVSPQSYSATSSPPCVTATLSSTSSPTVSQLTGTVFAVGTTSSSSPPPGTPTLTVTASSATFTEGGTVPVITPSYTGFVNGDTAASLTTAPTCSTTATSSSPPGTYPSTCTGAVDANYTIIYVAGTVTINTAVAPSPAPATTTTTTATAPPLKAFPDAGTAYPNGAIVSFGAKDYVFAGGRALATTTAELAALEKVDHAKVVSAPGGTAAPTGVAMRPGTVVTTRAVNGSPVIYVAGSDGELHGFSTAGQFSRDGYDVALVVTVPSLGGEKVGPTAGVEGSSATALATRADGAIIDSAGTFYVFAGGRAFGISSPAALSALRASDRASAVAGAVGEPETGASIASGVVLSAFGKVYVSYQGVLYPFKSMAQLAADGYGGTAAVPVPGTGGLSVVSSYSGG